MGNTHILLYSKIDCALLDTVQCSVHLCRANFLCLRLMFIKLHQYWLNACSQ